MMESKLNSVLNTLDQPTKKDNLQKLEARLQVIENCLQERKSKHLILKTTKKCNVINTEDIIRLQADNTYTIFYLLKNKKITVSTPIKHYESMLPKNQFFRTHRSHIINISHVSEYIKGEGGTLRMSNGDSIPLAKKKKTEFLQILESY